MDVAASLPSGIIRFICHIPTGMIAVIGTQLYRSAKHVHIYNALPAGNKFLFGLGAVGVGGCFTFAWNFIMFPLSFMLSDDGVVFFGVGLIDLVLGAILLAGVISQARFLPPSYGPCGNAINWRNATDGRNFFLAANETGAFSQQTSPNSICHAMVKNWIMGIVVVIFYLLCAVINIIIGLKATPRRGGLEMCGFLSPITFLVLDLIPSAVRFGLRYLSKYIQRLGTRSLRRNIHHLEKLSAPPDKRDLVRKKHAGASSWNSSGRSRLPASLPVRVKERIASYLHYADLISLTRSSQLRSIFIGDETTTEANLEHLRPFTCGDRTKSQCGICSSQICALCLFWNDVSQSQTFQHLTYCRPYCSKCFYNTHFHRTGRAGLQTAKHRWYCLLGQDKPSLSVTETQICRFCYKKSSTELQRMLEARDAVEIQRLTRHPLACENCSTLLPDRGPRWWVCSRCGRECSDHVHPPWATGV